MGSNSEQRITRLENILKDELGSTDLTQYYNRYPVRLLKLTEEVSYDDTGTKQSIAVATWTSPAGVITPTTIRILINNVKTDLDGTATSYRITGHKAGETISVTATAIYTSGNSTSTTATIMLTGDATAPGLPTAFTASTGGFRTITLHWTNPADSDLDYTEVWHSATNSNLESAEAIAQANGDTFIHSNLGIVETHYYWIRSVDRSGNKSNFVGTVSGVTAAIQAADIPEQSIAESKLVPVLMTQIDSIHQIAEAEQNNAVTISNYKDTTDTAIAEEATARTTLSAKLGDNVSVLQQQMNVVSRKTKITSSTSAPTNPVEGDIWANNGTYKQYDGSSWQTVSDADIKKTLDTVISSYTVVTDANGVAAGFGVKNSNITGTEFAILADNFKIANSSGNKSTVFTIDSSGNVNMAGSLIASGSITGDKIYSKTGITLADGGELLIGQGGLMQIGNGGILLDDEDADNPRILCKDTSVTNGDYAIITSGAVRTFRYLSGSYREIKALTKVVTGTVLNGNTVTLPGYWTSQPYVLVTPAQLKTYVAAFYTVDQTLQMSGANVTYNSSTGVATFKAEAQLVTGAGNGTLTVPDQANQTNSNDETVGTSHTLTTATVTAGFTVSTLTVSASCYGRLGWSHSSENYDRDYEHTVNYTLYLNVDGTDYTMGSGTFTPTQYASSSADHNITVQLDKTISSIYLKMVFSSSAPTKAWTTGASANTSWIKCNSINYTVNSSTQLATGTVNYIAIAQ